MPDKYDEQIERLVLEPERIVDEWYGSVGLFLFATPRKLFKERPDGKQCGCLTMIRGLRYVAWTDDLTSRIQTDERIPRDLAELQSMPPAELRATLEVFAAYQREMDATIRNPEWKGEEVANG